MKFYTKEWYELMQRQNYTSGLKKIPDKVYTDDDIQAFYDKDLKAEVAHDRKIHNTPPGPYDWEDELLLPDRFTPDTFLFENGETGELFHPETPEIARHYLEQERRQAQERFAARPPFDPTETIACFQECYRGMLRYGFSHFPQWVRKSVDPRLLALNRIPESAYKRLRKEEQANRRAFEKINAKATAVLDQQDIPEEIRERFYFHDASVLAIKKVRSDVELYLRKDGGWLGDATPYIKIIFKNVRQFNREKGFSLRPKLDADGDLRTSCTYLYDELYHDESGYEVHMLLCTPKALRYLTICCEDIHFEDNISLELALHKGVSHEHLRSI